MSEAIGRFAMNVFATPMALVMRVRGAAQLRKCALPETSPQPAMSISRHRNASVTWACLPPVSIARGVTMQDKSSRTTYRSHFLLDFLLARRLVTRLILLQSSTNGFQHHLKISRSKGGRGKREACLYSIASTKEHRGRAACCCIVQHLECAEGEDGIIRVLGKEL